MRSDNPTRCNPAPANTKEENSPQSSFCNLVMILPRTGKQWQEGNSFSVVFVCESWRNLFGQLYFQSAAFGVTPIRPWGRPRFGSAVMGKSGFSSIGISFRLWTQQSMRPSANAISSSFHKQTFAADFIQCLI